jgi:isopentenyl-diphosphate Delta-isomerase
VTDDLGAATSLVERVDPAGRPVGEATVTAAHTAPGILHRAFSVVLQDDTGRVLLQRRAAAKTRFPLRWANSCCGHPRPGEPVVTAARRRLAEELGLHDPVPLREVGILVYRATDPATGRVEHEYDHVLLGRVGAALTLRPDPAEVAEVRWLGQGLPDGPEDPAPWLAGVLAVVRRSEGERGDRDAP